MRIFLSLSLCLVLFLSSISARADHADVVAQIDDAKSKIELGKTLQFGSAGHVNRVTARQLYGEAEKILRPLAEQGDAEAQFMLGMMYLHAEVSLQINSDGIWRSTPDYVDAMKWFRKAAEQDHRKAQLNVSWLYLTFAEKKDLEEAYFWRSIATRPADPGDMFLDGLEGRRQYLTSEQKKAIGKRVEEWQPTPASVVKKAVDPLAEWRAKGPPPHKISDEGLFSPEMTELYQKSNKGDSNALATLRAKGEGGDIISAFFLWQYYIQDNHTDVAEAYYWGLIIEKGLGPQNTVDSLAKQLTQNQKAEIEKRAANWKLVAPDPSSTSRRK